MKYIDSEKLIAEIERLQKRAKHYEEISLTDGERSYWSGEDGALELLITFITSLQQEQPKFKVGDTIHKKGENTVFPMVIERISDGDYVCDNDHSFINIKYQDDYELVQQEQPEVDLDALVDEAFDKYSSVDGYGQLSASFNRAELYSFIKKIARKEE